jgi:hypothetical protein
MDLVAEIALLNFIPMNSIYVFGFDAYGQNPAELLG